MWSWIGPATSALALFFCPFVVYDRRMIHTRAHGELADALTLARGAAVDARTRIALATETGHATPDELAEIDALRTEVETLIARVDSARLMADAGE